MTILIRFAIALILAIAPLGARAGTELALGFAEDIDQEETAVATIAYVTWHRHPYEFLLGHLEARDDEDPSLSPTTTFVAASKRLTWRRFYTSLGVALTDTNDDNDVLSGPLQFLTALGYGGERWSISLRHLSNASIEGRNRGETFLMVAFHF